MNRSKVIVGAIAGGIGGAIVEAVLVASVISVFRDILSDPGVPDPSLPSVGVSAGAALVEGLVVGLVAGAISGAVGCRALLVLIAAAFAGFATGALWMVGGAAGGLMALIAIGVMSMFEHQPA